MGGLITYQDGSRRENVKGGKKPLKKITSLLKKRFGQGVKNYGKA